VKYLLFAGDSYYADGGALDLQTGGEDLDELITKAMILHKDWWHIFDTEQMELIAGKAGGYCGQLFD